MCCPLALRSEQSSRLEGRDVHASRQRFALPQHKRDNQIFILKKLAMERVLIFLIQPSLTNHLADKFSFDWRAAI